MTDARTNPTVTDEILEDCLQAVQRSADQGRAATAADVSTFAHIPPATAEAVMSGAKAGSPNTPASSTTVWWPRWTKKLAECRPKMRVRRSPKVQ